VNRFLRNYTKMKAEANNIKLSANDLATIVNNLCCEDELWDTIDSFVNKEIAKIK